MTAVMDLLFQLLLLLPLTTAFHINPQSESSKSFVQRSGAKLSLDGKPFRFAGPNAYWLGLDENVVVNGSHIAYPTEFRVDDATTTAAGMGATVLRCHTCGISVGNPLSVWPSLRGTNEEALKIIDYAIASATSRGLRLVIPLVDNWRYYHGGKHTFTDWRHLPNENDFYTNTTVISDFKAYIAVIIGRINSITGVRNGDNPMIMAWETGNELLPPYNWTCEISSYIKSLAPKQLVLDGNRGVNTDTLTHCMDVDLTTKHYYPPSAIDALLESKLSVAHNRPFFIGEFGWPERELQAFLTDIQNTPTISGDLFWSLFPHADDHGFVPHGDKFTLWWPQPLIPSTGASNATQASWVTDLRSHAYVMSGDSVVTPATPATAPKITSAVNGVIAWRGVALSGNYTVQRSCDGGPSSNICVNCASDLDTPWTDDTRPSSAHSCVYQVRGNNVNGESSGPWSSPVPDAPK